MAKGTKGGLSIELGDGWDKLSKWMAALDGNLAKASRHGIRRANQYVLKEIIERIKQGRYKKLAPLTVQNRRLGGHGTTPLLRTQALIRSITTDVVSDYEGVVGLNKQGRFGRGRDERGRFTAGGTSNANIGLLLHDGGYIKITDAMRRAFARRLGAQLNKAGARRLPGMRGTSKGRIRIPPRPFIKDVFEDPRVLAEVKSIYADAVRRYTGL